MHATRYSWEQAGPGFVSKVLLKMRLPIEVHRIPYLKRSHCRKKGAVQASAEVRFCGGGGCTYTQLLDGKGTAPATSLSTDPPPISYLAVALLTCTAPDYSPKHIEILRLDLTPEIFFAPCPTPHGGFFGTLAPSWERSKAGKETQQLEGSALRRITYYHPSCKRQWDFICPVYTHCLPRLLHSSTLCPVPGARQVCSALGPREAVMGGHSSMQACDKVKHKYNHGGKTARRDLGSPSSQTPY